jgi:uncharacterized metal-binding protein YceD (DUF177 family)
MGMSTSEFSRPFELERARRKPIEETLIATEEECAALAQRFKILAVKSFEASIHLEEEAPNWFRLQGQLIADVVQECIRTLSPLPEHIDEAIDMRMTNDPEFKRTPADSEDGVELSSGDDYEYVNDDSVDVGELVTQLLSTFMDPYPRISDDEVPDVAGVDIIWNSDDKPQPEQDVRNLPFAGLADLLAKKNDSE